MVLHIALALVLAAAAFAGEKKPITTSGGNPKVSVQAVVHMDKEEIKQLLGSDLGGGIAVVEVTVTPKTVEALKIFGDDFMLHAYNDGQKSTPFAPAQIAGRGGIALTQVALDGGGTMSNPRRPTFGGLGGYGGGMGGGGVGNAGTTTVNEATVKDDSKEKDNPLLKTLKQKCLPEKETTEPVKGLLYFPLEGKHKAKDLSLVYSGAGGRLILEFRQ